MTTQGKEVEMPDHEDAPDGATGEISFDGNEPVLSVRGHHVTHPDYLNALPFIERKRMTYDALCAHAAQQGLPTPSVAQWAETFHLTEGELRAVMAMREDIERELMAPIIAQFRDLDGYFVIRAYGNKTVVARRRPDGTLAFMTHPEFEKAYREQFLEWEDKETGETKRRPLARAWLEHATTPRYDDAEFLPGQRTPANIYNLWAGWPIELPRERDLRPHVVGDIIPEDDKYDGAREPKECALFLHHLYEHVCDADEDVYDYVLGWMADALVTPGLCETALVLRGPSGSGKGTFAHLFGSLFGPHYVMVNSKRGLVGNFNRHLEIAQLVYGDEIDFANENEASKTLRSLITEPTLQIEPKGVDPFTRPKWFRLIISSNDRHVVQAVEDDRRFLVLDVDAQEHNRDRGYFGDLRRQFYEHGGQVALFRWLTGRYWREQIRSGAWNVGQRPVTAALQEQKVESLTPADQFLLGIIEDGVLPGARPRNRNAPRNTIVPNSDDDSGGIYQHMRVSSPGLRNESDQRLAAILKRWGCTSWTSHGERGWTFPPLAELRAMWCRRFGDRTWPTEADIWYEEPAQQEAPF